MKWRVKIKVADGLTKSIVVETSDGRCTKEHAEATVRMLMDRGHQPKGEIEDVELASEVQTPGFV